MAARRDLQQLFTHKALPDHRLDKAIFELLPSNTHYEDAPLLVEASLIPADDPDIAAAAALIAKNEEDCSPDELRARRAVASMTGMAVGDAIGAPLEFDHLDYGNASVRDMGQGIQGAFCLKPGQWTDDASMGLCLADSLLSTGGVLCPLDLRLRFRAWWAQGYNNAFARDPGRAHRGSVGLGGNISQSMSEFERFGHPFTTAGDCTVSGNGSIMRLAPAAIAHADDIAAAMDAAQRQSRTTHQGVHAHECCRLMAGLIVQLIATPEKAVLDRIPTFFSSTDPSVSALAQSAMDPHDLFTSWNWKAKPFFYHKGRAAKQPGYIGSYCMDALSMALHCVYHTSSFREAVLKVVNLCGDSDSVGSVTAQIAGALYGFHARDGVPLEWLRTVQQWDAGTIAARALKLFHHRWLPGTTCDHTPVPSLALEFKFRHHGACMCPSADDE